MGDVEPFRYSVVIPAYNAAAWILGALASVADQSPPPSEIVVVDDGSTDDTAALAETVPGVRVVRRPNGGEAAARNTGLRSARERWVSFLDADDRFLAGRHEQVVAFLATNPDVGVVATDALIEVDGLIRGTHYGQPSMRFAVTDQRREILDANFLLSHVVCDRERLLALGGFDESLSHACDWDMWVRFIVDGGRIGLIDTPLSVYRRHDTAMTSSAVRVTQGDIAVWSKMLTLPQLTDAERARVGDHLVHARAALVRDQMKAAVATGDAGRARSLAVSVMRSPSQPWLSRVKAVAVLASPGLQRRLMDWRRSARHR